MDTDSIKSKIKNEYFARQEKVLFSDFRSFLPSLKFLQIDGNMSYTFFETECKTLKVTVGHLNGKGYVDSVQHVSIKQNAYNNFVNAFAYWEYLNEDGKRFFIDLYKPQFDKLMEQEMNRYTQFLKQSNEAKQNRGDIFKFFRSIQP